MLFVQRTDLSRTLLLRLEHVQFLVMTKNDKYMGVANSLHPPYSHFTYLT